MSGKPLQIHDFDFEDEGTGQMTNFAEEKGTSLVQGSDSPAVALDDEERPVLFYEEETMKFVEVFRSTHRMRWWDADNEKYVEYFSQAIEDTLRKEEEKEVAIATNKKEEHPVFSGDEENKVAVALDDEEERPFLFYEEDTMKFIEVFRSTHRMRWWDADNGKYVEYFSQAIEDTLNRNEPQESEDNKDVLKNEPEDEL